MKIHDIPDNNNIPEIILPWFATNSKIHYTDDKTINQELQITWDFEADPERRFNRANERADKAIDCNCRQYNDHLFYEQFACKTRGISSSLAFVRRDKETEGLKWPLVCPDNLFLRFFQWLYLGHRSLFYKWNLIDHAQSWDTLKMS